jgi:hypothetical protein
MSRGLALMTDRAVVAALPFAAAARLAGELVGTKAADLQTALGYSEHNPHRMRYAHSKKLG